MDSKGRKFFFGKYKGKYINDIIVNDTQYITWSMKNIDWFWYNHDEVELYKKQIKLGKKPKNQYELIMENIKQEEILKKQLQDDYFIDKKLNTGVIDYNKDWTQVESFRDKYLIVRFIFDTFDDIKLITNFTANTEKTSIR